MAHLTPADAAAYAALMDAAATGSHAPIDAYLAAHPRTPRGCVTDAADAGNRIPATWTPSRDLAPGVTLWTPPTD